MNRVIELAIRFESGEIADDPGEPLIEMAREEYLAMEPAAWDALVERNRRVKRLHELIARKRNAEVSEKDTTGASH